MFLGLGDGSFQVTPLALLLPNPNDDFTAIVAGDFNGDGTLDLALADATAGTVDVLIGNGDGTFQYASTDDVGGDPVSMVAADLNGDGSLDLAVANQGTSTVSVLMNNGDGTFQPAVNDAIGLGPQPGAGPQSIVAGNFTGNGKVDLAILSNLSYSSVAGSGGAPWPASGGVPTGLVTVLLNNGNGTFQPEQDFWAGYLPSSAGDPLDLPADSVAGSLVAGDFTGDGRLDLALVSGIPAPPGGLPGSADTHVSVLMNGGSGFEAPVELSVATGFLSLISGGFVDDGRQQLAAYDNLSGDISVLQAAADGSFDLLRQSQVAYQPTALVAADFNGDGRLDVALETIIDQDVPQPPASFDVLLGNGDGSFQSALANGAGDDPTSMVSADFNNDGKLDLAVTNGAAGTVTILLGNGGGSFTSAGAFPAGPDPFALVADDFNGDGRTDLAVLDRIPQPLGGLPEGQITILLGNGDGTFQPGPVLSWDGFDPTYLVAGDFTGNGKIDLAVASGGDVFLFMGNGDGMFQPAREYPTITDANALVTGYFNGGNQLEIAAIGAGVSVLTFNRDGSLRSRIESPPLDLYNGSPITAGDEVLTATSADFTGSGVPDIAVAYQGGFTVLLGNGDGTFRVGSWYPLSYDLGGTTPPEPIIAGDFNGDGRVDLAVLAEGDVNSGYSPAPQSGGAVFILMGSGDGTFTSTTAYYIGRFPGGLAAGNFYGDGQTDLATADQVSGTVSVLFGNGDGTFRGAGAVDLLPRSNPVLADVNGDGTDDVLVVDGAGDILYRQGIPGQPVAFEPPVTINPNDPSRDIAWVPNTIDGPLLASVDANDDNIALYAYSGGGFVYLRSLATGQIPAEIIPADLTGSGWDDLVVSNAGDGTLSVFLNSGPAGVGTGSGQPFLPAVTLSVGLGTSDVEAVDTTGDGELDLVVTNNFTGQVSVLRNLGDGQFAAPVPYRAGTGWSAIDPGSSPEVASQEATAGVAGGPIVPGGPTDLVTINAGSNTLDILDNLGGGRFADPVTIPTPGPALVVRMGDFADNGIEDVAALGPAGLFVYLGDGKGGFLPPTTYAVPAGADGLTVANLTGDGKLDLLVGDSYGDVLIFLGNGNGTFQPYREATQTVALAVADLTGDGSKDIIYADPGLDRVVVDYGAGNASVLGDQSTGLLEPGAVALADLNGDGIPDLIVANSGSNNVLIYPGLGNGQFGPAVNGGHGYFVGTNPVGITVANLTGSLPDLIIADQGSNQVSILLNQSLKGGPIAFSAGPRLNSGGTGPVSTVVGHFSGSPYLDLLVTNSQSNDVALLHGVGQGFFNDQDPRLYPVGSDPGPTFITNAAGQSGGPVLVTVNARSNDLTVISGFEGNAPVISTLDSGGVDPTTAFAFDAGNGFDDLVVGNTGDGELALFEGGDEGLSLVSVESEPDLPDPTALAFSVLTGGTVEFYAATAGRESADLVAFSLATEIETGTATSGAATSSIAPALSSGAATEAGSPTPFVSVQLVALRDTSLPLVATVLTLTLEGSGEGAGPGLVEAGSSGVMASVVAPGITVGQGPISAARGVGATSGPTDGSEEPAAVATTIPAALAPWERLVLGLDEALEELSGENAGGIMGPGEATDPPLGPGHPTQGGGSGLRSVPERPPADGLHGADRSVTPGPESVPDEGWRAHEPTSSRTGAIDAALARLGTDRAGSDPGEIVPSTRRPASDEPGLASGCVGVALLATRYLGLGAGPRRIGLAGRPSVFPVRRRPHVII